MSSIEVAYMQHAETPSAVALVGFMGAGKTSVGRELARQLRWEFVDLDARIAAETGKTVAQIFSTEGEAGFRKRESDELQRVLSELDELGPLVIALGGGTYIAAENRDVQRAAGRVLELLKFDVAAE